LKKGGKEVQKTKLQYYCLERKKKRKQSLLFCYLKKNKQTIIFTLVAYHFIFTKEPKLNTKFGGWVIGIRNLRCKVTVTGITRVNMFTLN